MPTQRQFPARTLEQALRVPEAVKQYNGGNPWDAPELAKALNLGPKSGNFCYLTAASRDYGLTEGTRDSAEISLTDLGRRAAYPASPEDEAAARLQAFLNVDSFRRVLDHYGGSQLPERE